MPNCTKSYYLVPDIMHMPDLPFPGDVQVHTFSLIVLHGQRIVLLLVGDASA